MYYKKWANCMHMFIILHTCLKPINIFFQHIAINNTVKIELNRIYRFLMLQCYLLIKRNKQMKQKYVDA